MYYNGNFWVSIQKSSEEKDAVWTPKDGGSYLLCYQIVTEAGEVYQSFIGYEIGLQFQKRTIVILLHGNLKRQEVIFCIWR